MAALGPGAIVASLTIGTGELIFSSRAGALFGYRTLGLFALVQSPNPSVSLRVSRGKRAFELALRMRRQKLDALRDDPGDHRLGGLVVDADLVEHVENSRNEASP